jgi:4-hydroxy-3-polyprenylbenzoate decarboxylase
MSYRSLADFLEVLENAGELVRIAVPVDPELELAEVVAQFQAQSHVQSPSNSASAPAVHSDSPALLFQNVKGCRPAVAVNLLGTETRIRRALGVNSLAEMAQRLCDALAGHSASPWFERLKWGRGEAGDRWQPKFVRTGACQQVVRLAGDVDLATLPALKNWPDEAARSIAAAQLYSLDPENGERSIEPCEAQILDRTRLALMIAPRGATMRRLETCRQRGERLPIALVLGGDPACRLITGSPIIAALDSFLCGGLFRGQPVELVKCRSHDLGVPADADLVIEAYIDPTAPLVTAGPVGTAGGFYSLPRPAPVAQVMAITERTSPICPAVVSGQLGGENAAVAQALSRIGLPLVQAVVPELVDYALPGWGGPLKFLFVSIRKTYPFQARKVASALWGWEPLAGVKTLVIVDAEVNVQDTREVWSRVGAHVHPGRDVFNHLGPGDIAEHAIPAPGAAHSLALDATAKLPDEHPGPWPGPTVQSEAIRQLVHSRWAEYGLPPHRGFRAVMMR